MSEFTNYPERGVVVGRVPGPLQGSPARSGMVIPVVSTIGPIGLQKGGPGTATSLKQLEEPKPKNTDRVWGILLTRFSHPIFDQSAEFGEVRQGSVLNCPLPALLAAMAHSRTLNTYITITENKQQVQSTFEGSAQDSKQRDKIYKGNADPKDKTDRFFEVKLPKNQKATEVSDYFWSNAAKEIEYAKSSKNALWVSIVEKAFVQLFAKASYDTLADANTGPSANDVFNGLTGSVQIFAVGTTDGKKLTSLLQGATKTPTIARHANPNVNQAHALAVLKLDTQVQLFDALNGSSQSLSLNSFKKDFDFILLP